jgi:geranylgeranyl diphosphate synthase type II
MSLDLKSFLEDRRTQIEKFLKNYFDQYSDSPSLVKAMTYSLEAGGKRIRPILSLAAFEAAGGKDLNIVMPFAAALECIHTYSLIHDDLPAMDDDDLRRGKPTNHKIFGEAVAILAGDGLLTEAFALMATTSKNQPTLPADVRLAIIKLVADAAGGRGMVGGQLYDLEHESKKPTLESLKKIHTYKTGRLLTVSVEVGALAAGVSLSDLKPFTDYGYHLGYAFQIIDDVLDVVGGAEIGKTQKSDLKHEKATFVALLGVEGSKKAAADEIDQALQSIAFLDAKAETLVALAKYITSRSY